jgi:hypothetical protein
MTLKALGSENAGFVEQLSSEDAAKVTAKH